MGLIRLYTLGFVGLTIIYVFLSLRARWRCKAALEAEYDAGGIKGSREDFVDAGLAEYAGSLRRKLILGVYVVPVVVILTILYVVNF